MLRLGGELCLGNTLGMRGRGEVRALGLVKSQGPFAIIAPDRDFYGLELNEPGNSGEVFVLLCSFKYAFDAQSFVLRTMMGSITFGAAF